LTYGNGGDMQTAVGDPWAVATRVIGPMAAMPLLTSAVEMGCKNLVF